MSYLPQIRQRSRDIPEEVTDSFLKWMRDPVLFVNQHFNATPDAWQVEVLRAFADTSKRRIAMKACKNPGKTAVLAWIAWLFLLTRPHCKVIACSISGPNLADGLWSEMARWQRESPLLMKEFEWNKTTISKRGVPGDWFMAARQWRDSASPEEQADTLSGKHADYMLFILDEAGGIPESVMVAAEAALGSGTETRLVIAGNPTSLNSPLHRACTRSRTLWTVFEITGDPDAPNRAPRVNIDWARGEIETWGRDNPWVMANVLGQFPPASINSLFGPDQVEAMMRRAIPLDDYQHAQRRIGVDVARFGDDRTVIFPRQGLVAFRPVVMRNARSNEIAARIAAARSRWKSEVEFIDDSGGFGSGVIDFLLQGGHSPVSVQFGGKPDDPRYLNKRAEMWFRMSDWAKRGGVLPHLPELKRELCEVTYTYSPAGKFQLEQKDQIKARLGVSPDLSDALATTFCYAEMPAYSPTERLVALARGHAKAIADYNPLETSGVEFAEHSYDPLQEPRF